MKLNARQKAFCEYYVASGNATEAAIKAVYSERTTKIIIDINWRNRFFQNIKSQAGLANPELHLNIGRKFKHFRSERG